MCGIAGVVQRGRVPDRDLVESMAATLAHRGPDDSGCAVGEDFGFGFRRLAIIDLASGNQPLENEDGTITSVFNGEIYNYRELREELAAQGHTFRTSGDAEVLPHLYEEHGPAMVERLRGMFGLAIWDSRRRELFLARDRAGEKPMYYTEELPGGGFGFASEMKALLAAGVRRDPDPRALVEYLYHLYVPAPRSAFASIRKLPPGHTLLHGPNGTEVRCYWRPQVEVADRSDEEHVAGLREHVFDAIRSRLVADVPVGAFLSGGIDSTTVVAGMKAAHEGPVHTFTISFDGFEHYDESEEARATAKHFGTEHHELRAELDGPAMLPTLVHQFDEPFGNPTAVLVSSLSEVTREHVKVVLTGDGGDELFFGYPRYRGMELALRYRRWSPRPLRALGAAASRAIPESTTGRHAWRRAREFLSTGTLSPAEAYRDWIGYFTPELLGEVAAPPLAAEAPHATDFLSGLLHGEGGDLNEISRAELQSFLPFNVLEYADKMSMAHSLELRAPFVDHRLVDYVATMPAGLKLRDGVSKWALRQALGPDLPQPVLKKAKLGLNPPLNAWLQDGARPLVRELLSPEAVRARGLLRPEAVANLLEEQERGRRDRSMHVWGLLVLEMWFRERVDS